MQNHVEQVQQHDERGGDRAEESGHGDETPSLKFLPEEIVETIMARMPFPNVFRARVLSNSWNCKFSHACTDSTSTALNLFQKEVNFFSHKWPSYCPVLLTRKGIRGFDRVSWQWHTLFQPMSSQWKTLFHPESIRWETLFRKWELYDVQSLPENSCSVTGSLLLISNSWKPSPDSRLIRCYVMNLITGTSMLLPRVQFRELAIGARREGEDPILVKILPGDSNTSYRVLLIIRVWNVRYGCHFLTRATYDSKVHGWTFSDYTCSANIEWNVPHHFYSFNSVYLHGKFYYLDDVQVRTAESCTEIGMYVNQVDLLPTEWRRHGLTFPSEFGECEGFVTCGGKVMLINFTRHWDLLIIELDLVSLGSWTLVKVLRLKVPVNHIIYRFQLASDDDFIYFSNPLTWIGQIMAYNVQSGEFVTLPLADRDERPLVFTGLSIMLDSAFTPGLNPFPTTGK